MSDALTNGRKFRTFNVIDDYNRQGRKEVLDMYLFAVSSLSLDEANEIYNR